MAFTEALVKLITLSKTINAPFNWTTPCFQLFDLTMKTIEKKENL